MPYRICKSFEIENGHMLSKHPDKCRFPHGHSRKVELILEADTLDANEMVCDFKVVKELMQNFLDSLDHALCMNTDDPEYERMKAVYGERVIGYAQLDPTTEVLAESIFRELQRALAKRAAAQASVYAVRTNVRVVRVRLWETSSSWAEFWEADPA
jgi:6-pyruvoyltetrahydropterin/6-carboxytetrahydropterin synthase